MSAEGERVKRAIDVVGAAAGLALAAPILALAACAIKLEDNGPVFFRQMRLGLGEEPFEVLKLRTMTVDAEKIRSDGVVEEGDPRITRIGALLRRTAVDELPQLWNVLRGEMSLVGPRPVPLPHLERYDERQRRVGRDGRFFEMFKFRSMRPAPEGSHELTYSQETAPGGVEGADRRTRVGSLLRRTSLDELPQLFNVLRGEMSLVGPRPERPEFVNYFNENIYRYGERHRVKSGLTGWAQVNGLRGKTSLADRVEWDNHYIENFSLWLDLKIMLLTIPEVLRLASRE